MFQLDKYLRYLLISILIYSTSGELILRSQTDTVEVNNTYRIPELVINSFSLFEREDILELTLMFDITTFMRKKPNEEYLDALLTYKFNEKDSINKKIRIRARGNYRYRNCQFPPIRLNFRDSNFGYSDIDSLVNVKMVTHCFDNETYQNYLMREYLIYKLYNLVTDYSFKVRFMKVRYIDTGRKGLDFEQYGFLIEPVNRLLFRSSAIEIEDVAVTFKDVDPELMGRLAVFQYLLGNSDWYLPMIHNFKIIKRFDTYTTKVIPVPYDFDYSGFVNTHYAMPREDLNLQSITDRVYLGPCVGEDEFRDILDEFLGLKDDFLDEVRNFEYLDRTIRRELIDYINSFFDLYKKDILLNLLMNECIKE